jgi:hypothetical protein
MISKIRKALYTTAKVLGDVNAVKQGKVIKRVERRVVGKISGNILKKITK